jgi:ABC-type multidrug transport system permease subunit
LRLRPDWRRSLFNFSAAAAACSGNGNLTYDPTTGRAFAYDSRNRLTSSAMWQSLITPVITTALYFVVFGSALDSRMTAMEGISYGAFIVPGLTLLSVFMQSIFNASFGIYFPKFTGTIYELLSAPISSFEAVVAYVGVYVSFPSVPV